MIDQDWLNTFLSEPELHPNKTGHSPFSPGSPDFGGRGRKNISPAGEAAFGLGWLYYALVRLYRPKKLVCIGSGRGFVPIVLAKALRDSGCGSLDFIDPSLDDDFWKHSEFVSDWFERFGVEKFIRHHLQTTEEFSRTEYFKSLENIDFLFIDGRHFYESVRFDFEVFRSKVLPFGLVLFHDSFSRSVNPRWSGPRKFLLELKDDPDFQIFDFPFGAGLTLLGKRHAFSGESYLAELEESWKGAEYEF